MPWVLGTMRCVYVGRRYAVKLPRVRLNSLRREIAEGNLFEGFRANRQEGRRWREERDPRLCPVILAVPFGLALIMPSARPLSDDEFNELLMRDLKEATRPMPLRFYQGDLKRENYGTIDGNIVRLDYGEPPRR